MWITDEPRHANQPGFAGGAGYPSGGHRLRTEAVKEFRQAATISGLVRKLGPLPEFVHR
jgi:hypothetical protein